MNSATHRIRHSLRTVMIVVILFSLILPVFQPVQAATKNEKCYKNLCPKLYAASIDYVKDIYQKRYPEMSLRFLFGTQSDKKVLKKLADKITNGYKSDRDKTEAVIRWAIQNIDYDLTASAFPMDTFYRRKGNCMSFSYLITQLLRLEGIPAVPISGWRGNMKKLTQKDLFESFRFDGHGWIYVLLGSKWVMYDPLFEGDNPVTDEDYRNSWYYTNNIEGVSMIYDGLSPKYVNDGAGAYYAGDGRFKVYWEGSDSPPGNVNQYFNNISWTFNVYSENDGFYFEDDPEKNSFNMKEGEVYAGERWISYDGMFSQYVYGNGMHPTSTIINYNGETMFCADGGAMYRILCGPDDFWIEDGFFTVKTGFSGKLLEPMQMTDLIASMEHKTWYEKEEGNNLKYTVKTDGTVNLKQEGIAGISYYAQNSDGGYNTIGAFYVQVKDKKPVADYSSRKDNSNDGNGDNPSVTKTKNKITKVKTSQKLKAKTLKKKNLSFKLGGKAKGKAKLSYKMYSVPKKAKRYITVSKSGKVTVRKGLKKGSYTIKVKITSKATKRYKKTTVKKTVKIVVK